MSFRLLQHFVCIACLHFSASISGDNLGRLSSFVQFYQGQKSIVLNGDPLDEPYGLKFHAKYLLPSFISCEIRCRNAEVILARHVLFLATGSLVCSLFLFCVK